MGREISAELTTCLALEGPFTATTLSIYPTAGDPLHLATDKFTFDGVNYESWLETGEDIRQSIGAVTNRFTASIQQVTKDFGIEIVSESLVKATGIVGRYYRHKSQPTPEAWVELFRGEVIPIEIDEAAARIEILHDLVAAGFCIADWTLAENCQLVFKHAGTCGYAGSETHCNKRRKSLHGCFGRDNEHHFGGMEFPDVQIPSPPVGGDTGGDGGGGPFPTCPRLDQYVLVRGYGWQPEPREVKNLRPESELYNPIWKTFHEIDSGRIVPDQPIWCLETENGGRGFSSWSHPVIQFREHTQGIPVSRLEARGNALTFNGRELEDSTVKRSFDTGRKDQVMQIEMVNGHIYCYSDTQEGPWTVCHNFKDPDLELLLY